MEFTENTQRQKGFVCVAPHKMAQKCIQKYYSFVYERSIDVV